MAKTRSQGSQLLVKKEECEDKPNLEKLLHSTSSIKNKIVKSQASIKVQHPMVKGETILDQKPVSSSLNTNLTRSKVTKDQIANLINFIENDKMSIHAASKKVQMSYMPAQAYYHKYKHDPERKIPLPKTLSTHPSVRVTREKIENLIHYIVHDKMNMTHASFKADIERKTADKYYALYLADPDRKIPELKSGASHFQKSYTQKQIDDVIGYIVDDKMSIRAASKKAKMHEIATKKYYILYLEDPDHKIPPPGTFNHNGNKVCTNDQVKKLIRCIADDGMSLLEASARANMSVGTGMKYYEQYLDDPNHNIPTPETNNNLYSSKQDRLDRVKKFFTHVIIDKLKISAAARKANIGGFWAYELCKKHLENPGKSFENIDLTYSPEKMKNLVDYIQRDKMTVLDAAKKAKLDYKTAQRHYRQYVKDPQRGFHKNKNKQYSHDDVKKLIHCIKNDKMNVNAAARKIKMSLTCAHRFYKAYRNDPEHNIPHPMKAKDDIRRKTFDTYSQIVADVYKEHQSIKTTQENQLLNSELPKVNVKQEHFESE